MCTTRNYEQLIPIHAIHHFIDVDLSTLTTLWRAEQCFNQYTTVRKVGDGRKDIFTEIFLNTEIKLGETACKMLVQ